MQIILNRDECRTDERGAYLLRAAWGQTTQIVVRAEGYVPTYEFGGQGYPHEPIALRRAPSRRR